MREENVGEKRGTDRDVRRQSMRLAVAVLALGLCALSGWIAVQAATAPGSLSAGSIRFGRIYRPSTETFKYPQTSFRVGRSFGWIAHLRKAVHANRLQVAILTLQGGSTNRRLGPVMAAPGDTALVSIIHSSLPGPTARREGLSKPGIYRLRYSVGHAVLAAGTFRLVR